MRTETRSKGFFGRREERSINNYVVDGNVDKNIPEVSTLLSTMGTEMVNQNALPRLKNLQLVTKNGKSLPNY